MSLKGSRWVDHGCHGNRLNVMGLRALGQIQAFLEGTGEVWFQSVGDDEGPNYRGPRSSTEHC
jgi:hypothetical protein